MRDIFGVDLREGDALELWYGQDPDSKNDAVQIVPVSGCYEDGEGKIDIESIRKIYGTKTKGTTIEQMANIYNAYGTASKTVLRAPIGKVWATPLHHPFQSTSK